jgi:hypothetical protein
MHPAPVSGSVRVPLTGCDAFFLALEDLMRSGGQGRNVGLTVLELGEGFDACALAGAARRFSLTHPLSQAKLERAWLFGVPRWRTPRILRPDAVSVTEHPSGTSVTALCRNLLAGNGERCFELHHVRGERGTTVVARWSHLLFDGRGAELAFQELAGWAQTPPCGEAVPVASWGEPFTPPAGIAARWRATRAFVRRHYELKPPDFQSLGGSVPQPGRSEFRVMGFSLGETRQIQQRASRLTGGIFQMPYFFAAVARAHAAVFRLRGVEPVSYVSPVPIQSRSTKDRHPIFQNQVTVLHFKLPAPVVRGFEEAVAAVHSQFAAAVREGVETSAAMVLWWMRRMPPALYRRFLQRDTGGQMVSFFQSHTGEFLAGLRDFCGARIENGWHIPAVSQPPGSGIFFSEREGRLSATISWHEGVMTKQEVDQMEQSLRADLLGVEGPPASRPAGLA